MTAYLLWKHIKICEEEFKLIANILETQSIKNLKLKAIFCSVCGENPRLFGHDLCLRCHEDQTPQKTGLYS